MSEQSEAVAEAEELHVVTFLRGAGMGWDRLSPDTQAHALIAWQMGEAMDSLAMTLADIGNAATRNADRLAFRAKRNAEHLGGMAVKAAERGSFWWPILALAERVRVWRWSREYNRLMAQGAVSDEAADAAFEKHPFAT